MDSSSSEKIKSILIQEYNYKIYKAIGSYFSFDKAYMIFIYWKTDKELDLITDPIRKEIKKIIIDYFLKNNYYPNEVEDVIIYFDSDENVQKNIMETIFMQHDSIIQISGN